MGLQTGCIYPINRWNPTAMNPKPPGSTSDKPGRSGQRRAKRPVATPPRGAKAPLSAPGLALPHERDESARAVTAAKPDPVMVQAHRDIEAGLVDTDMRATAGMDAALRARLVPGPGGEPPSKKP